jgi:hypothetical protein
MERFGLKIVGILIHNEDMIDNVNMSEEPDRYAVFVVGIVTGPTEERVSGSRVLWIDRVTQVWFLTDVVMPVTLSKFSDKTCVGGEFFIPFKFDTPLTTAPTNVITTSFCQPLMWQGPVVFPAIFVQ